MGQSQKRRALEARLEHEVKTKNQASLMEQVMDANAKFARTHRELVKYVLMYQLRFRLTMAIAIGLGILALVWRSR